MGAWNSGRVYCLECPEVPSLSFELLKIQRSTFTRHHLTGRRTLARHTKRCIVSRTIGTALSFFCYRPFQSRLLTLPAAKWIILVFATQSPYSNLIRALALLPQYLFPRRLNKTSQTMQQAHQHPRPLESSLRPLHLWPLHPSVHRYPQSANARPPLRSFPREMTSLACNFWRHSRQML